MAIVGEPPLLAVCIPTHQGRAQPLGELLGRLVPQLPGDGSVEVCVSDNASSDGTAELVAGHGRALGETLRYRRNPSDLGLLENMFAVVEMASAEYCWLMGSDDAPADDAVPRLLALLRSNPGISGAHLGFFRRGHDDLDVPSADWPPDILPRAARPLRLRTPESYALECGVLSLPLSLNVVHRGRWRAVVRRERHRAMETPIVPQVYVTARMVQRDPDWLWAEDRLTLLRHAPIFLEERAYLGPESAAVGRQILAIAADLDRAWANAHGRRSPLHRSLMATFGGFVLHPAAASGYKLASPRLRDELACLRVTRHLWHSREFRRKTLPILLTPASRFRIPEGAQSPDLEGVAARLHGAIPRRMITGRGEWVDVLVENTGRRTLSYAKPYYAALYARWTDPRNGEIVEERIYNTPLYPSVRPGRSRRLRQFVRVPEPGVHELEVDLISRKGGRSLTPGPLRSKVDVELPTHLALPGEVRVQEGGSG